MTDKSPSLGAIRKRAQRAVSLHGKQCCKCGATQSLTRHHPDYGKPLEVEIICKACHQRKHWQEDWGHRLVTPGKCTVCGAEFQRTRSRRGRICGNPSCLAELGRLSAEKRWRTERTD